MSFLRLQYTRSDGEVDTYHLKSGRRYHVGRGSACEVRILDMRLSRKHCAFECIDGDWLVADLGSTNGCKINKKRIQDTQSVDSNTVVTLGSVDILVASISEHLDEEVGATTEDNKEAENALESEEDDFLPSSEDKSETFAGPLSDNVEESVDKHSEDNNDDSLELEDEEPAAEVVEEKPASADEDVLDLDSESDEKSDSQASEYNPTTSAVKASDKKAKEETKTVFISALGKKVGPLTRTQARELKKRELKGALTEKELEQFIDESS